MVDLAALSDANFANPALFYRCGQNEFGLLVPDGSAVSKVNLEIQRATTGQPPTDVSEYAWSTHVLKLRGKHADKQLHNCVHEVSNSQTLETLTSREFNLYEQFQVPLRPGAVVYMGGAPIAGVVPFQGWLNEVIVNPSSGTGSRGGG